MGITEEGGRVARGVVETFKRSPTTLALFIMNLALLYVVYVIVDTQWKERQATMVWVHDLIVKCPVVPQR